MKKSIKYMYKITLEEMLEINKNNQLLPLEHPPTFVRCSLVVLHPDRRTPDPHQEGLELIFLQLEQSGVLDPGVIIESPDDIHERKVSSRHNLLALSTIERG